MKIPETTRLPRKVRRVIRRRSERQAKRIYGPALQGARQQRRVIKRQYRGQRRRIQHTYRQDVRSTRRAVSGFQKILAAEGRQNASGAFGLTGRYKQEVGQELAMRGADAAHALPQLTAEARQTRAASLADLRTARASDMADAAQAVQSAKEDIARKAAETFASQSTSARLHRYSNLKDGGKGGVSKDDVRAAVKVGGLMLATTPSAKLPWGTKSLKHFGSAENSWKAFTRELLAQEGVSDPAAAIVAARILRRKNAFSQPWENLP